MGHTFQGVAESQAVCGLHSLVPTPPTTHGTERMDSASPRLRRRRCRHVPSNAARAFGCAGGSRNPAFLQAGCGVCVLEARRWRAAVSSNAQKSLSGEFIAWSMHLLHQCVALSAATTPPLGCDAGAAIVYQAVQPCFGCGGGLRAASKGNVQMYPGQPPSSH